MTMEPAYTVKEILDIQFRAIEVKLDNISSTLKDQHTHFEKSILKLEKEIGEVRSEIETLKADNARYKTLLGIGATIGATLMTFLLNRIF